MFKWRVIWELWIWEYDLTNMVKNYICFTDVSLPSKTVSFTGCHNTAETEGLTTM